MSSQPSQWGLRQIRASAALPRASLGDVRATGFHVGAKTYGLAMANRRALSNDDLVVVESLLRDGATMTAVAAHLAVSYKTVQNARKALGLRVNTKRARPIYPPELRAEVVRRYLAGESTGQVARSVGVSDSWVQAQLRVEGVEVRPTGKLAGRTQEIADRYTRGESSGQIAAALGVADTAVLARIRGIPRREPGWAARLVPVDHDAFSNPTAPATAYWLGFLMADGCVYDTGRVTLALQDRDRGHVQAWLDFMGSTDAKLQPQPAGPSRSHPAVRAQVSSRRVVEDLKKHGVVPRKTHAGVAASSDVANQPAFWRGMVDGDGTIGIARGKHGPVLSLCGSPVVMNQFADFLANSIEGFRRPNVLVRKQSPVIRIVQMNGVRARQAVALLWEGVDLDSTTSCRGGFSEHPCLERKVPRVRAALGWRTRTETKLTRHE